MIFKIGATIPTVQYGNLMPEIEVEAETFEEAQKIALPQMQQIWNSVCAVGSELKIRNTQPIGTVPGKSMICSFSGEELFISPDHTYTDSDGNVFMSGSKFAHQFSYPFDKAAILPRYAAKFGVEPQEVDAFWTAKGDLSRDFGHALHGALELFGKYTELTGKLSTEEKAVELGIPSLLKTAVEDFFYDDERVDENAMYEVFVVDKQGKRCGQIDRLVITGDKKCIIEDYKTNGDLYKQGSPKFLKEPFNNLPNQPISEYTLQLNFYREIMESLGWTVEGLRIHHYDDVWTTIPVEVTPLT